MTVEIDLSSNEVTCRKNTDKQGNGKYSYYRAYYIFNNLLRVITQGIYNENTDNDLYFRRNKDKINDGYGEGNAQLIKSLEPGETDASSDQLSKLLNHFEK